MCKQQLNRIGYFKQHIKHVSLCFRNVGMPRVRMSVSSMR